jgi:hypothetical protein
LFITSWSIYHPTKPDIAPDGRWRIPMNILIRAALAAISLATITPVANAAMWGTPQSTYHSGPYDNTGHGGNTGGGGGGG